MTEEQMRELVKECGLDWLGGDMTLFDGDPTSRYAVLIKAVLEQQAAPAQPVEPVAWIGPTGQMMPAEIFDAWRKTDPVTAPLWKPLFAAPPAPAAQQPTAALVPLTDEQISDIAITHSWEVHALARAIERAHGIAAAGDKP